MFELGKEAEELSLQWATASRLGQEYKERILQKAPNQDFYPDPLNLKGPMVTEQMREEWRLLDAEFALKRTKMVHKFTQMGFQSLENMVKGHRRDS